MDLDKEVAYLVAEMGMETTMVYLFCQMLLEERTIRELPQNLIMERRKRKKRLTELGARYQRLKADYEKETEQ